MRALVSLVSCGVLAAMAAGCGGAYDNPIKQETPPSSVEPAESPASSEPAKGSPQAEAVEAKPDAGSEATGPKTSPEEDRRKPAGRTSPQSPSAQPNKTPIQLSAGVALPQSLPTGTAMGFSVDYKFVGGRPDPAMQHFWVIQPAKGKAVRQPVRLKAQGTLEGFVMELRPENGPFQTYVEDKDGARLSQSCPLR